MSTLAAYIHEYALSHAAGNGKDSSRRHQESSGPADLTLEEQSAFDTIMQGKYLGLLNKKINPMPFLQEAAWWRFHQP